MARKFPVTVSMTEPRPKVTKVEKYGKSPYITYCEQEDCKVWMPHGGACRRHAVTV